MRKLFLLSIFIFFFIGFGNSVFSARYGNHSVSYDTSPAVQNCNDDSDGISDPIAVALNNGSSNAPHGGTPMGVPASGTMRCLYWDGSDPISSISNTDGRTNSVNQTVSYSFSDAGGSGLNVYHLYKKVNGGSRVSLETSKPISGNLLDLTHNYTGVDGNYYEFMVRVYDDAWLDSGREYSSITRIDTIAPTSATITSSTHSNGSRSSNNDPQFSISPVGEGPSPDTTYYCRDTSNSCNPSTAGTSITYSNLSDGTHYFRAKTCDTGGCSPISSFTIKIDANSPSTPTVTSTINEGVWNTTSNNSNPSFTINSNGAGPSPYYNEYCIGTSACTPNIHLTTNQDISTFSLSRSDGIHYFSARTCDTGGCSSTRTYEIRIDTTDPVAGDIRTNDSNLLADDSGSIDIYVDSNGYAPINLIQGFFEDEICNNGFDGSKKQANSSNTTSISLDFSEVKPNPPCSDYSSGLREYTFKVTYVRDSAGNDFGNPSAAVGSAGIKSFDYNVYANTNNITTNDFSGNPSFTSLNTADGTEYELTLTLFDDYNNPIVDASSISRLVDVNFNVSNTTHLDQYNKTGDAIYMNASGNSTYATHNDILTTGTRNINNLASSDGAYVFGFKVYAPVNDGGKSFGEFIINSATFDVDGTFGSVTTQPIDNDFINFSFKPLYETSINSEVILDGFIKGAEQTGDITVSKNTSTESPSGNLYLEFGSGGTLTSDPVESPKLTLNLINPDFEVSGTGGTVHEGYTNMQLYEPGFTLGTTYPLNTLLTQDLIMDTVTNQYLSSHIGYSIDGYNILYNSDIIGKSNYWADPGGVDTTQEGLKISGISSSQNQVDITTDQNDDDLHIIGNIDKTILKKDMRKKVYNLINNVDPNNGSNEIKDLDGTILNSEIWDMSVNGGVLLLNNTVLYYGDLGGNNVELDSGELFNGNKTIIVEGGNLYIKSNITNNPIGDHILGIIVLKDDDGNGGNLYIDPEVTEINAVIYTDKSLISYDGTNELDGNTSQYTLRNQLYIYGSVFSENTIGGSRDTPPICPYYVGGTCELKNAQMYDLNFLRRYYVNPPSAPINSGTPALLDTDPYYKYPVVIKYNSKIQTTPPPLFGD